MQTSDILQVQFRSVSVVQPPRGLPHGLESRCTDSGREAHKQTIPSTIFHDPWSKGIPKEVKLRIRVMSFTTSVLAIDDMRLVWMHFEAARRKTIRKRHLDGISLHFGFAMYQSSSRPGEFHPQALTDPDVSVSTHPALIVQPPRRAAQANGRRALDPARKSCGSSRPPVGDVA